jgi:N-acetylglucosamine-6-phosphate deacetylase
VSEIVLTVYPSAINTMRENMLAIKKAMEQQKIPRRHVGSGFKPAPASRIIGVHLEGPFLNSSKCGALDAQSFLKPDEYTLKQLIDGFEDIIKIITIAPEIEGAVKLIKKIAGMGIIASMGHSDATYSEAEAGFHAGARGLTHIFNAMRGIHHREPGIAGFGLMNRDIYIEVIADFFHLEKIMLEFIFSVKDPDRIIIVSDTVKSANKGPYSHGIKNEQGKLLGGCMTVQESSEKLVQAGINKETIFKSISENPARYLQAS